MKTKTLKNKLNTRLSKLTVNRYFDAIPLRDMSNILKEFDLSADLDGIYCGNGETNVKVNESIYLRFTWYKMESGRYEIVAYVS